MNGAVWAHVAKAVDSKRSVEAILEAMGDAGVVLWRGGFELRVAGESTELRTLAESLHSVRARANVQRGLVDRAGRYGLQPLMRDGQVVGALILTDELMEIAEPLSVIVAQAMNVQNERDQARALLREVWKLRQQLRDAARVQTALLSQARHDLRTPLTALKGYADMINRGMAGPVTPTLKRYVDRIGAAVEREVRLLEEKLGATITLSAAEG
ncbi:MAG: histidine kinase dimerization/phospho-acceptor domain-containing protein [Myxococcaceae bacterium]